MALMIHTSGYPLFVATDLKSIVDSDAYNLSFQETTPGYCRLVTIRPNTYLDDTRGKIVIYSWHMAASREKSGKRRIFPT